MKPTTYRPLLLFALVMIAEDQRPKPRPVPRYVEIFSVVSGASSRAEKEAALGRIFHELLELHTKARPDQDLAAIAEEIGADLRRICQVGYFHREMALDVSLCIYDKRMLHATLADGSYSEKPHAIRVSWFGIGFGFRACVFPGRSEVEFEVVAEESFRRRCRLHDAAAGRSGLRCCW